LQFSDTDIAVSEIVLAGTSLLSIIIAYLAYRRQPPIPTETQKAVVDLSTNFADHIKDDEKRFSDLWKISNDIQNQAKVQAADIKVQIAEAKLANAEGQTEIKVTLGKVVTSVAYIEAQVKNGLMESAPK
jgi:hypothetical protein